MISTDYLQVSDGSGDASLMHITELRSIGSTIIKVDTIVGVPQKFIGTSGTLDSNNFIDASTITNFTGHINGTDLEIDSFLPGSSDKGNTATQVVVIKPNTAWANAVAELASNSDSSLATGWINVIDPSTGLPVVATYISSTSFSVPFDATSFLTPGAKFKLTNSTEKFFFETKAVFSGGVTTFTVYGGTDYTLASDSITGLSYSQAKAPSGFPMNPNKWSVIVTDSTERISTGASSGQWKNPGSMKITLPTGVWIPVFRVMGYQDGSPNTQQINVGLSTTNSSAPDPMFTIQNGITYASMVYFTLATTQAISTTSETIYYLNISCIGSGFSGLRYRNQLAPMIIEAVCAYL